LINQRQKINIMALPNVKWRKANPWSRSWDA
jgi:hypothetical protein